MVNYLAETTYTRGSQTFGLAVEQKYNPDLLEEGDTPNWHSVNRSPELFWRLTSPRISGTILPVRLELKAGHYHEFPSDTAPLAPRRYSGASDALLAAHFQHNNQVTAARCRHYSMTKAISRSACRAFKPHPGLWKVGCLRPALTSKWFLVRAHFALIRQVRDGCSLCRWDKRKRRFLLERQYQ